MKRTHLFVLLLGVVLALAGPVSGEISGGGAGSWSGDAVVLRRMMSTRLEDDVPPELTVDLDLHRSVLAGGISPGALNPDRPACPGSCAGRGRPYTNRGCEKIYRCRGGS